MVIGRDPGTSSLALGVGVAAIGSAVSLAVFFAVQGPFGTINDIGNGATGVLGGLLAWRLRSRLDDALGRTVVGAALVGAGVSVVGSALVISGATGFFLAGLVSSLGFAGIGAWLVDVNRRAGAGDWPVGLRRLGLAAGAAMALGIVAVPGIVQGLDDMETAPAWAWIGFIGWLGIYALYPAWAIWLSRVAGRSGAASAERPEA